MGIHDGHRERLKKAFIEHGLESMNDIQALELLLFFSVARRDTNELAQLLLERFRNLDEIFHAAAEDLMEVPGVGEHTAVLLTLLPQIMKKSAVSKANEIRQITSSRDAGKYLVPRFADEQDEVMLMLCLDNKRSIICCCEMGRGVVNAVNINARKVVEKALKVKASSVIIAHNHPGGLALPSREDDTVTKTLYNALEIVGVHLEDHIIVAVGDYVSLADTGMMYHLRF